MLQEEEEEDVDRNTRRKNQRQRYHIRKTGVTKKKRPMDAVIISEQKEEQEHQE